MIKKLLNKAFPNSSTLRYYNVDVSVANRYWSISVLVSSDTPENARRIASAMFGRRLEQAGIKDASTIFVVGRAVPLS